MRINRKAVEKLSKEQGRKFIDLLAELEEIRQFNPLWFYNHPTLSAKPPHAKQLAFHDLRTQSKAFLGGNQSGKTTAGIADDLIQALNRELVPPHLRQYKRWEPPFFFRVLVPSLSVLELVFYEKFKELCPPTAYDNGSFEKAYDKQLRVLRFANGSLAHFMTYEQDVGVMGGATLHRVHYDEEPPRSVRNENRIRLVKHKGDEIFTQTPQHGLTWAYDDIWEASQPENGGEEIGVGIYLHREKSLGVVVVDMDENPYLTEEGKSQVLAGLSNEERQSRKEGKFVHFAGKIYGEYDEDRHVCPQYELRGKHKNLNVVVGIDPGIRHACGVVYCALTPSDDMYVFDEIYVQGQTISQICEQIHRLNTYHNVAPIYYVIDPASRNKNNQTGRSDQMEFSDHGIHTIAGQNAVEAGINRIKERLQNNRLFIFENCTNLRQEFKKYRWRDDPRTGEDGKPLPIKKNDHLLDALRYAVMSRPYLPQELEADSDTQLEKAMKQDQQRGQVNKPTHEFGGMIFG
jgi:phage terminase large subunit-like protein